MDTEKCSICDEVIDSEEVRGKVHFQGLQNFIAKSKSREDEKWKDWEEVGVGEFITVHEKCRKRYSSCSDKPPSKRRKLNETVVPLVRDDFVDNTPAKPFDYLKLCILCDIKFDERHNLVRILNINSEQDTIKNWSKKTNDEKAKEIVRRVKHVKSNNIVAKYHAKCRRSFTSSTYVPQFDRKDIEQAFKSVTDYIENSGEFKFNFIELVKVMEKNSNLVLSEHVVSKKLEEKYGDDILISRRIGKRLVYFYKTTNLFERCNEWLADPNSLSEFDKNILLKISADIIKSEVQDQTYELRTPIFLNSYATDIPKSLKTFLDRLLANDKDKINNIRRDSIAHTIISSIKPRNFISNLQLAVGTCVMRKTGSKLLVNLLSKLGISATYYNLQMHEASTAIDPPNLDCWIREMVGDGVALAPESSLRNTFCGCTGDCSSARCSCRKTGLKCMPSCKNCNGQTCHNSRITRVSMDEAQEGFDNITENENHTVDENEGSHYGNFYIENNEDTE